MHYAVLSQIWKYLKSRVFGANFLGQKLLPVLNFSLFATMSSANMTSDGTHLTLR